MLAFMTRAAARDVESVLKSAIANAETNHGLSARELYVLRQPSSARARR